MKFFDVLDLDSLQNRMDECALRAPFARRVRSAKTLSERCEALLGYYRALWPVMQQTAVHQWATDPYEIDWPMLFTPIEYAFWSDIRAVGAVLYPQHPVAGYFVDFGHPIARVAIECDGEAFHRDCVKDRRRQLAIEAHGWTVYRLTGRQCFTDTAEVVDFETGRTTTQLGEAMRLLLDVSNKHGLRAKPTGLS